MPTSGPPGCSPATVRPPTSSPSRESCSPGPASSPDPSARSPMKTKTLLFGAALMLSAGVASAQGASPRVALDTTEGKIVIELAAKEAPKTVDNFLTYVKAGHYDGTVF